MSTHAINISLQQIQQCNPKERIYLRVVGKGSEQHLEQVKKNWFGRLLMWLGLTSSCMKKVADFVSRNIDSLYKAAESDSSKIGLLSLVGRISKYNDKHPKRIQALVNNISKVILAQPKPTQPPQITSPLASPLMSPLMSPMMSPLTSPMPVASPKNSVAPPAFSVAKSAFKTKTLNKETLSLLKAITSTLKKTATLKNPIAANPGAGLPHSNPKAPSTLVLAAAINAQQAQKQATIPLAAVNVNPMVPVASTPTAPTPEELDQEAARAEIEYWVDKFKKERNDFEDVSNLINRIVDPFKGLQTPFSTSEMTKLISIIQEMTPDEIYKYVESADLDLFKIKEGSLHFPSLPLTVAIAVMTTDQLSALAKGLSDSSSWDLTMLRDANFKIAALLRSQNKEKELNIFINQSRYFASVFETAGPNFMSLTQEEMQSDATTHAYLSIQTIVNLLKNPRISDWNNQMRECWLLAGEHLACMKPESINKKLTLDEQENLTIFLIKEFDGPADWNKKKGTVFVKEVLKDPQRAVRIFKEAKKDNKRVLFSMCNDKADVLLAVSQAGCLTDIPKVTGKLPFTSQKGNVGVAKKIKR